MVKDWESVKPIYGADDGCEHSGGSSATRAQTRLRPESSRNFNLELSTGGGA